MYSPHKSSTSSSEKKSSLPIRFMKWTLFQMISFVFAILLLWVGYAAWTTLSPSQWASGQPVNQTLVQGIINNINDLDSRIMKKTPRWVTMAVNPGWWIALVDPVTSETFTNCYSNYLGITVQQFPSGTSLNFINYFNGTSMGIIIVDKPTWAYRNTTGNWVWWAVSCVY